MAQLTTTRSQLPFGQRVLKYLMAAAWAFASEAFVMVASFGLAAVPAFVAFIFVRIFEGTSQGLSSSVFLATWFYGMPVIWLVGVAGLAVGIRRILDVPLLAPLFGSLSVPALLIVLVATGAFSD